MNGCYHVPYVAASRSINMVSIRHFAFTLSRNIISLARIGRGLSSEVKHFGVVLLLFIPHTKHGLSGH